MIQGHVFVITTIPMSPCSVSFKSSLWKIFFLAEGLSISMGYLYLILGLIYTSVDNSNHYYIENIQNQKDYFLVILFINQTDHTNQMLQTCLVDY